MKDIYDFLKPRDPDKPRRPLPELYKSPMQIRPDYLVCPLPVNFDSYRGCCLLCNHCYCRELDSTMYPAYWDGYDPRKVAPADMKEVERVLKLASSEKETNNLIVKFLRAGVPIHMGNKSEPYIGHAEDEHHIFEQALKMFGDYGYNVWVETKTALAEHDAALNAISKFPNEIGIGVSIVPNTDFMNKMESDCDHYALRYNTLEVLSSYGIHAGIKAEPIMPTINDSEDDIAYFFHRAEEDAEWVTFFNYKTRRRPMARVFFEQEGYDFDKMYEVNQDDDKWRDIGKRIFDWWKKWSHGFNLTSADIFTFPLEVNGTCCCGWDIPGHSKINFQHIVETIKTEGSCGWNDVKGYAEKVLDENQLERFKYLFHTKNDEHYTLHDCPEFKLEKGRWRKRKPSESHGWAHIQQ